MERNEKIMDWNINSHVKPTESSIHQFMDDQRESIRRKIIWYRHSMSPLWLLVDYEMDKMSHKWTRKQKQKAILISSKKIQHTVKNKCYYLITKIITV